MTSPWDDVMTSPWDYEITRGICACHSVVITSLQPSVVDFRHRSLCLSFQKWTQLPDFWTFVYVLVSKFPCSEHFLRTLIWMFGCNPKHWLPSLWLTSLVGWLPRDGDQLSGPYGLINLNISCIWSSCDYCTAVCVRSDGCYRRSREKASHLGSRWKPLGLWVHITTLTWSAQ